MKMYRNELILSAVFTFLFLIPGVSFATDIKAGEKAVYDDLRSHIPEDKFKKVDDLYKKWQEVQNNKSKAIILDIRTRGEFDAGHIIGSNNIDSGHAYVLSRKIADPNTEIWVFCRTKHRASYFVGTLYKYGFKNVYIVEGGIKDWAEKGYPLGNRHLGEIKVIKYHKELQEDYLYREDM
jgi:rhodanese-related sulfurtransferase